MLRRSVTTSRPCVTSGGLLFASWPLAVRADFQQGVEDYQRGDCSAPYLGLLTAAQKGDGAAPHALGFICLAGKGVTQSNEQAIERYRKGAEQGDGKAPQPLTGKQTMKVVVPAITMVVLFATTQVRSQMSTTSELPYHNPAAVQDPTDYGVRDQNAKMGRTIQDWAHRLDDVDPAKRLQAVRLLAESGKTEAHEFLIRAVDNRDPRVATVAIDALGKLGVREASELLVERLSTVGTSTTQQHILVALGKIRDPESARRVLDFVQAQRDPEVRAVAIRVLGDIGDDSVRSGVEKLSQSETDPRLKALMQEVVAKMTLPKGPAQGELKSSVTFSHSEPTP
jgi:hypothetical protein